MRDNARMPANENTLLSSQNSLCGIRRWLDSAFSKALPSIVRGFWLNVLLIRKNFSNIYTVRTCILGVAQQQQNAARPFAINTNPANDSPLGSDQSNKTTLVSCRHEQSQPVSKHKLFMWRKDRQANLCCTAILITSSPIGRP